MTTTLRPTGPERRGPGGTRSRSYEVCVNSRPVGSVELATDERFGASAGRIAELRIGEPDRRRGRATVAALAAEEVLRGWGCSRVEISVPAAAEAALRMAAGLGYTERYRGLAKQLPERPPVLPAGSEGRAMNATEFAAWLEDVQEGYVRTWMERGLSESQARAKSEADHQRALPDGIATRDTALRVLAHDGADVGTLWLALGGTVPAPGADAFVYYVEVAPERRGEGHGRSLMLLAERECRAAGAARLALNVFTSNTPALRLYESLGYEPTLYAMYKPLL